MKVLRTKWRRKPASMDRERNYVAVTQWQEWKSETNSYGKITANWIDGETRGGDRRGKGVGDAETGARLSQRDRELIPEETVCWLGYSSCDWSATRSRDRWAAMTVVSSVAWRHCHQSLTVDIVWTRFCTHSCHPGPDISTLYTVWAKNVIPKSNLQIIKQKIA